MWSINWLVGGSDAGRDWEQEEKGTTEDEMAGWHHWLDGRESEWTPGVGDGQGRLACCNSGGRKESDTTEWLNWTELVIVMKVDSHLWMNSLLKIDAIWKRFTTVVVTRDGCLLICDCRRLGVRNSSWEMQAGMNYILRKLMLNWFFFFWLKQRPYSWKSNEMHELQGSRTTKVVLFLLPTHFVLIFCVPNWLLIIILSF